MGETLNLSRSELRRAAHIIWQLQQVDEERLIDVLAFVCKCVIENEPHQRLFDERRGRT